MMSRSERRLWLVTTGFLLGVLLGTVFAPKANADNRVVEGTASTYGGSQYNGLLALPEGRGIRVEVCSRYSGKKLCVVRTSNDAGPSKAMQRQGRIVDLDAPTFEYLCQCSWRQVGLIPVTVEYLGRANGGGPRVTPPPTDIGELSWTTRPFRFLIAK